jgi:hypothetical protein
MAADAHCVQPPALSATAVAVVVRTAAPHREAHWAAWAPAGAAADVALPRVWTALGVLAHDGARACAEPLPLIHANVHVRLCPHATDAAAIAAAAAGTTLAASLTEQLRGLPVRVPPYACAGATGG